MVFPCFPLCFSLPVGFVHGNIASKIPKRADGGAEEELRTVGIGPQGSEAFVKSRGLGEVNLGFP